MPDFHRHELWAIFLGGAAGGLLRVWLSRSFASGATDWPWTIFAINVSGAFTLACIATWFRERPPESRFHHPLWTAGFCGTYTTFSTMQLEIFVLLQHDRYGLAAGYALASILAGYLAIWLGTHWCDASAGTAYERLGLDRRRAAQRDRRARAVPGRSRWSAHAPRARSRSARSSSTSPARCCWACSPGLPSKGTRWS